MSLKDSRSLVVELINKDNSLPYTVDMLNFGPVVVLPEDHNSLRDVSVYLTPTPTANRKGERTVYYNRLDLGILFGINPSLEYGSITNEASIIALLNDTYDTAFSIDDLFVVEYVDGPPETVPETITFEAKPGSYAFKGSVVFSLVETLIDLADEILITQLNGLVYPDGTIDHLVDPFSSPNETLPSEATNGSGRMWIGTGNPAENFVVASNGEITVGITARRSGANPPLVPVNNGVMELMLAPDGDWTFPYSVSLAGEAIGIKVTDLYNVRIVLRSDSGDQATFILTEDDEGMFWDVASEEITITDDYISETGDIIQNIQRLSHLPLSFANTPKSLADVPTGMFTLSVIANRKDAIVKNTVAALRLRVIEFV